MLIRADRCDLYLDALKEVEHPTNENVAHDSNSSEKW